MSEPKPSELRAINALEQMATEIFNLGISASGARAAIYGLSRTIQHSGVHEDEKDVDDV